MSSGCSIRAIWILNNLDAVVFSRRFPVVEKRWRSACKTNNENIDHVFSSLPSDSNLANAFVHKKLREGSARGLGIRKSNSTLGSDSWVDDPITRHIIGLYINKELEDDRNLLWPLILHIKGHYSVLVLPMVEPRHVKAYERLCKRPECGGSLGLDDSLSSLLLELPGITGRFGIGTKLVEHLEEWCKQKEAKYAYMATDCTNEPSMNLFTKKCGYSKFRTLTMLVQPVHAHHKPISTNISVLRLPPRLAGATYSHIFTNSEFFPKDIDLILSNKLNLGTYMAIPRKYLNKCDPKANVPFLKALRSLRDITSFLNTSKTITQAATVAFFSNLADVGLHGSMMVLSQLFGRSSKRYWLTWWLIEDAT